MSIANQIAPAIHMNGNSRFSLFDEWADFEIRLGDAIEAIPYESFHGRNQYPKSDVDQAVSDKFKRELRAKLQEYKNIAHDLVALLDVEEV